MAVVSCQVFTWRKNTGCAFSWCNHPRVGGLSSILQSCCKRYIAGSDETRRHLTRLLLLTPFPSLWTQPLKTVQRQDFCTANWSPDGNALQIWHQNRPVLHFYHPFPCLRDQRIFWIQWDIYWKNELEGMQRGGSLRSINCAAKPEDHEVKSNAWSLKFHLHQISKLYMKFTTVQKIYFID